MTILEAHEYPGGMVGGAIPAYRLPKAKIDQDLAVLARLGVEIRYGQTAGVDFSLDDLRAEGFEMVFIAVGAQRAKLLGLAGEDAEGVMDALRFLRSVREGAPVPIGDRVGVIGAGDTAMDAVRSALRVGAQEASLIYRRTIDQMPADPEEIHACREEGVRIVELASPHALHVEEGRLAGLICSRTEYRGDRDAAGRKVPHDVPDSAFEIPLDTLILAISQHSVLDFFADELPALTERGYIDVDPFTFETSRPGVYAIGDVAADGPSSIVKAAADGKAVAAAIIAKRSGPSLPSVDPAPIDLHEMVTRRARRQYRVPIESAPLEARDGFSQTVLGYTARAGRGGGEPLPGLSPDLQPVRGRLPQHGTADVSVGAVPRGPARAAGRGWPGGRGRATCLPGRAGAADRGADRLLQRVRQLCHRLSDLRGTLSRQAAPLSRPRRFRGSR